jgi:hypothetical protein
MSRLRISGAIYPLSHDSTVRYIVTKLSFQARWLKCIVTELFCGDLPLSYFVTELSCRDISVTCVATELQVWTGCHCIYLRLIIYGNYAVHTDSYIQTATCNPSEDYSYLILCHVTQCRCHIQYYTKSVHFLFTALTKNFLINPFYINPQTSNLWQTAQY